MSATIKHETPARAPAAKLPPYEILNGIVNFLPRKQLAKARLIHGEFATVAAPRLFHMVSFWISVQSLQKLTELSQCWHLRHYVQEVVFSLLSFVDDLGVTRYLEKMKAIVDFNIILV